MSQTRFPPGWDEERVRRVLAHYEQQTPEEAVAEDEAAFTEQDDTVMKVPRDLVPAVRQLIASIKNSLERRISPVGWRTVQLCVSAYRGRRQG